LSESTLFSRINAARHAISDSGDRQRLIRTIIGKGIRFIGAVRQHADATLQEALRLFEQASELDPASIPARVAATQALCVNMAEGWSNSVQEDKARAEGLLLPAIERDANNDRAHRALGLLRRLQNRLEESRVEWETAIALQPYDAHAFLELCLTLIFLGQPEAAILQLRKAT
jgi:tetratricopeptide (TPR) repeat protein